VAGRQRSFFACWSLTERIREISVRKPLGASRHDIVLRFTLEAITLTAMGTLLGVALGAAVTCVIPAVWSSLPARRSVFWTSFGFGSAAAEGLLFSIIQQESRQSRSH